MQAYKLRIAHGHHTQVLKVCVEPKSNCAAFVLDDSSCVLVSLSSLPSLRPTSIPGPCTDACFLRLQERVVPSGGGLCSAQPSRAHHQGDRVGASGGDTKEHHVGGEFARGTPIFGPRGRAGVKFPANGKLPVRNVRARTYFLTAQSSRGGSFIDLSAWLCEPPSFSRANVEIDRLNSGMKGPESLRPDQDLHRNFARPIKTARLDVPHGMVVKMAASVNVIVVYSISAGKIWVLAAKHVPSEPRKDHGARLLRGGGVSPVDKGSDDGLQSRKAEIGRSSTNPGSLLLIKCAFLECNKPVYSLHVSLQHLLLGENGGVWIWPLRPLVKRDKRRRREGESGKDPPCRAEDNRSAAPCSLKIQLDVTVKDPIHKTTNSLVNVASTDYGRKSEECKNDLHCVQEQAQNGIFTATGNSSSAVTPKNGLYYCNGAQRERATGISKGSLTNGVLPRKNGFHDSPENCANGHIVGSDSKGTGSSWKVNGHQQDGKGRAPGYINCGPASSFGISLKEGHSKFSSVAQHFVEGISFDGTISYDVPVYKEADSAVKTTFMESRSKTGSVLVRNGTIVHDANGHDGVYIESSECFSSESEGQTSFETNSSSGDFQPVDKKLLNNASKKQDCLGYLEPMFVPTSNEIHKDVKESLRVQVVRIEEICARRFLVLDSHGSLHLLTLNDDGDRVTTSVGDGYPQMTPLNTSIKVSSVAVLLPSTQKTSVESKPASSVRKIWITDGLHSNYVASLPVESRDVVTSKSSHGSSSALSVKVAQTVFTCERVTTLSAVSPDTVLVVTQGSVFAYTTSGS